uniref:YjbH domain-containing protein n=1 Tax=Yoonia sp. TaxID=2212373 RepID=UPI004047FC37
MKQQKNAAANFLGVLACILPATAMQAQNLSTYGTTGLIDMPSAATLDDGALAFTSSFAGPTIRNTLTFQITPKLQGTLWRD